MIAKTIINRLNLKLEDKLNSLEFEHNETEFTAAKKKERRALADKSDFDFCKIYFEQIFTDGWNGLHRKIEKAKTGVHTISGSRYFGKSAFTYVTKIVKPLAIGGGGMIGIGLRTQDLAASRSEALVRMLKRNKLLQYDYDINIQQDRSGDYIINHKQFVSFGYREGLRNYVDENFDRFEAIIIDDLFNRQTVNSEVDNEKILNFVESECTGQLNPGGLMIWLFNYITVKSPGYVYAEKHPDNHYNLPALDKNEKTNWKESSVWTTKELHKKRASLTFEVWMGDWMNSPLQKGEEFDIGWLRTINAGHKTILKTISFVDPAHGTSPQACYKSIITFSYTDQKEYVLQDIYLRKEDYNSFFNYASKLKSRFEHWQSLLFENDFAQWNVAKPYYAKWKLDNKASIAIQMFNSKDLSTEFYGADKESRIRNLILPFCTGEILINQDILGTKDYEIWLSQYIGFGKLKGKLDGLDATASAYILFPRYIATGSFKSLGKKKYGTKNEGWLYGR